MVNRRRTVGSSRNALVSDLVMAELVQRAKLNKPSNEWKTSEWDRVVDDVVDAMKRLPPTLPGDGA